MVTAGKKAEVIIPQVKVKVFSPSVQVRREHPIKYSGHGGRGQDAISSDAGCIRSQEEGSF
jgi:hypothetical protein